MEESYVVVVGGINVDICGKSFRPLIPRDSNPGTVRLSMGGVGRNIAHNLRLLGCPVKMLTAVGGDLYAAQVEADCGRLGIDLGHALRVPGGATSTYLVIEGPEGDMELALCDGALAESVSPEYLASQQALLDGAAAVVTDTNLSPEALAWLGDHCGAPIFADPVSVTKARRLAPLLGKLFCLKPNLLETELLSGIPIRDRNSLELAASKLLSAGLERVCISLGSRGVYCAWDTRRCLAPCPETRLVNASGGGDAMMAGFVRAYLDHLPIQEAAPFALACSALAVESSETVNPNLSLEAVGRKLGRTSVGAVPGRPESPSSVGAVTGRPESPVVSPHPIRKQNRLQSYDYTQGGAYHVVICTEGRKCLLSQIYDGPDTQHIRLSSLGILVETAVLAIPAHYPTVEVVRYSIMPNHVHLLLRFSTGESNPALSWVVNQFKGAVTKGAGRKIWQKGFYDEVIRTEAAFQKVGEYVEFNPAKWKTDEYYVCPK